MVEDIDGIKVKCSRCNYEWVRKSKTHMILVTCPSCGKRVKLIQIEIPIPTKTTDARYEQYLKECAEDEEMTEEPLSYAEWVLSVYDNKGI